MSPDLAIVHAPVGGGHKSVADAVADAAHARGLRACVLDGFDGAPSWASRGYVHTHFVGQSWAPALYGLGFAASNHKRPGLELLREALDFEMVAPLVRRIAAMRPRAIVVTHHLPLAALTLARARGAFRAAIMAAVSDYGAHAVWADPRADRFAVGCEATRNDLVLHGIAPTRVDVTGIPCRRGFADVDDLSAPTDDAPLRVLLTSGGFGAGMLRRTARLLSAVEGVDLTVVCGRAASLERALRRDVTRGRVRARVIGFERHMPRRLAECHVVAGKAGGATVTEALVAGRPLLLVGAVPGQESYNVGFARFGGAAVQATPRSLDRAIALLRSGETLRARAAAARSISRPDAADAVVTAALALAMPSAHAA